ncbi:MAG: transposase [Moorea sp. SIO3I7]|nr:transposase [Moorena sp. SIO3I7]
MNHLARLSHQCQRCKTEICRDTNAALNILKKGMNILGVEYNSTLGHRETAGEPGTLEETTTSAVDGQLETVSGVAESRINCS